MKMVKVIRNKRNNKLLIMTCLYKRSKMMTTRTNKNSITSIGSRTNLMKWRKKRMLMKMRRSTTTFWRTTSQLAKTNNNNSSKYTAKTMIKVTSNRSQLTGMVSSMRKVRRHSCNELTTNNFHLNPMTSTNLKKRLIRNHLPHLKSAHHSAISNHFTMLNEDWITLFQKITVPLTKRTKNKLTKVKIMMLPL